MSQSAVTIEEKKEINSLAMTILLISFSMLFASLFLGYVVLRFSQKSWPPQNFEKMSMMIPTLSTLIILLSSLSFEWMKKMYRESKKLEFTLAWFVTLNLAFAFMISQTFLWKKLNAMGLFVSSGIFASVLHGFTWIHAAHVVLGILALFYLSRYLKKDIDKKNEVYFINVGKFWHFLGIVWLIMYIFIFLF